MTAPTPDLDALLLDLREVSEDLKYNGRATWAATVDQSADALAAVTAERDQARSYLDGAEGQLRIRSDEAYEQRVRATRAESLLDQARQMLADAPHDQSCVANVWTDDEQPFDARPCNCWKSGL